MKKYAGFVLGLFLIGLILVAAFGLCRGRTCGMAAAQAEPATVAVAPVEVSPQTDLRSGDKDNTAIQAYLLCQQKADSDGSDLNASLESAQQALEQLLEDYAEPFQESPGRDAATLAMDKAMVHARLARIALPQGDPIGYERHLAIALELSGEPNEDSLFKKLDLLDQAQQN